MDRKGNGKEDRKRVERKTLARRRKKEEKRRGEKRNKGKGSAWVVFGIEGE